MKILRNIFICISLIIIICAYCFWRRITYKFCSDPGSYLLQIICMLIPLFVTFYMFYVESNERKQDNRQQEKQIKQQQESQKQIIKSLTGQIINQKKLSNYILSISEEINKMRRPRGLSFIYKYKDTLNKYVSSSDQVQTTVNVTARYIALEKICKEWANIKDDEIPLTKLHDFNWTRNFLKEYMILLLISWDFLIEKAEKSGEIKKVNNIFGVGFNNCMHISTMVAKGIKVSQEFNHSSLEKIIDKYGLESINIESEYELKTYIDLYSSTSQEEIEKEFIDNVEQFQNKVNSIYDFISEWRY